MLARLNGVQAPTKMTSEQIEAFDNHVAIEVLKLLDKITKLKFKRAFENQVMTAKTFRDVGSGIYDSKGNLVGQTKASIDPYLAHRLTIERQKENPYMRENNLGIFADKEYLPFLQKKNPELGIKFKKPENKISLVGT